PQPRRRLFRIRHANRAGGGRCRGRWLNRRSASRPRKGAVRRAAEPELRRLQANDGGSAPRRRSSRTVSLTSGFSCRHLAVVGLGLMGGSLALALRSRAATITGVDMNPAARQYALANG